MFKYYKILLDAMRKISLSISDESWTILRNYQEKSGIKTRDEALDTLLIEFAGVKAKLEKEYGSA